LLQFFILVESRWLGTPNYQIRILSGLLEIYGKKAVLFVPEGQSISGKLIKSPKGALYYSQGQRPWKRVSLKSSPVRAQHMNQRQNMQSGRAAKKD
jgi:hypothetical protein